ncbi:MAG: myo-inositol 2-dehydrogenase [Bacteroidetes bacterium GWE2_29_8]|nr:MAG: myo-inositol 2-dehydrogenase [Bacteroidetes bacterium GWE2_29_8]OFY20049.1 MAG: myo-inositol 2-dehydrogenase [Bacteroidetes bacterium GWF2_29_10]
MNKNVLLVGSGPMAIEYAKVLTSMNCNVIVVGRSKKNANEFFLKTNISVIEGGIDNWLINNNPNVIDKTIVCVSENELDNVVISLIQKGFKDILVEKPAGLNIKNIKKLSDIVKKNNVKLFVGYNRRFYASVNKALQIINEDGGVTSFYFEFTEWSHVIKDLEKGVGVKENWFLQNSTHIIDLAFYICGIPKDISSYCGGYLDWHPSASIFAGAGVSESGALFNYQANWQAPGRWGIEVLTKNHRLIFRPIEKLHIQKIGSVAIDLVEIDDKYDIEFKPGLYKEIEAYLNNDTSQFCMLDDLVKILPFYAKIANYEF